MKKAYTLIEVLLVLAIISILAALLYPVFASVRERGRQTVCVSNMRQLGIAFSLYSQDEDDKYPYGGDPFDLHTTYWKTVYGGQFWPQVKKLQPINLVLAPYIKVQTLWQCPSDFGFQALDYNPSYPLNANNSSYDTFGTSYYYNTPLALEQKTTTELVGYEWAPPFIQHGPDEIGILTDGNGSWHGGTDSVNKRYNVLMGDGHTANLSNSAFNLAFGLSLDPPSGP